MSQYWKDRFELLEDARNKTAKRTVQAITPAFDQAQAKIEKEINAWYARFAKNNQIDLQEAKKLLNTKELKEFKWDVQEYIKYGRQNALDQKWMKELENASARFHISRLEALKIRTQNAAERAFGNELDQLDQMAARIYMDDYYHTAYEIQRGLGIGWDVAQIDQKKLDKIVSKPWTTDKMTFSDRIWKSKTQLVDSLHKELTQMCVLGKAPDQAIKNIADRMNVSKGQAGRLVMTEAAYFGSAAQKDCFNDLDVEQFEVVATLDSRTSPMCQEMDGKVFDMKDFQIGVTAPPFHVWCRSCTAPWFEDNDDGTRAARGEDGKTYQVPANMKYQDWKDHFVDKTKDPADWLKPASVGDIVEAVEKFVPDPELVKANKFGFGYIEGEHTIADDLAKVNPKYATGRLYQNNCGNTSTTYELRRRGYDVEANPLDGMYLRDWQRIFKNFTPLSVDAKRKTKVIPEMTEKILSFGEGSRGGVFVVWDGRSWGHYFSWEVKDGNVMFVDPQNNKLDCSDYFSRVKPSSIVFGRWDNLEMSDKVKDICKVVE